MAAFEVSKCESGGLVSSSGAGTLTVDLSWGLW